MKKISILVIVLFLFFFAENVQAKMLPQAAKSGPKAAVAKNSVGTGISVSPRVRADRRAVIVNFANLQNAKSVSYFLTYSTNGH